MPSVKKLFIACSLIFPLTVVLTSFMDAHRLPDKSFHFPYKSAGLTREQAAAHLLSRFTFGAMPGQIESVSRMGLEKWFSKQLDASFPDDSLRARLAVYDALGLSNSEIADLYPRGGREVRMAVRDGALNKDSVDKQTDRKAYRAILDAYMKEKGLRPQADLFKQFTSQKILRAAYSENQLLEVMTSFWFNHFNVALVKNECAEYIPGYERDVIRPNALQHFSDLLLHTAQSPAMLYYLDNFNSAVAPDTTKQANKAGNQKRKQIQGLNENYAREVMELHTLGVDGGYSQNDVTQAARVLTGWTVYPLGNYENNINSREKITADSVKIKGYVHQGDFLFNPRRHDAGEKKVLGHAFAAGGGYEEGVALLSMLAQAPATAHFICHALAVRFVGDTPATALVNKMAHTYLQQNGDIKAVLITMVSAPEFWSPASIRDKIKSPFELAISTVRSLDVRIDDPVQLNNWIARMGERQYNYQAPTGYPDRGQYWINTGSLLNRMNFGLAFASGRIQGINLDLIALNNHHEPESALAALSVYGKLLVPNGDSAQMQKRLGPLLNDPALAQKVSKAASAKNTPDAAVTGSDSLQKVQALLALQQTKQKNIMLAQVVGVLIGSPEFQRR